MRPATTQPNNFNPQPLSNYGEWYKISDWISNLADPDGNPASMYVRAVLRQVQRHTNYRTNTAWASQETLAEEINCSVSTIERAFKTARGWGLLKCSRRAHQHNEYYIDGERLHELQLPQQDATVAPVPQTDDSGSHGAPDIQAKAPVSQVKAAIFQVGAAVSQPKAPVLQTAKVSKRDFIEDSNKVSNINNHSTDSASGANNPTIVGTEVSPNSQSIGQGKREFLSKEQQVEILDWYRHEYAIEEIAEKVKASPKLVNRFLSDKSAVSRVEAYMSSLVAETAGVL